MVAFGPVVEVAESGGNGRMVLYQPKQRYDQSLIHSYKVWMSRSISYTQEVQPELLVVALYKPQPFDGYRELEISKIYQMMVFVFILVIYTLFV